MAKPQIDNSFYRQIQFDIDRIDNKADTFRFVYYMIRIFLIVFSSAISILSGWNGTVDRDCILNTLLILGVLSSAVTAGDTLFQIETKKNTYRLMLVELREIRSDFLFHYEPGKFDIDVYVKDKLFPKYQSVMAYAKSLVGKESEKESAEKLP